MNRLLIKKANSPDKDFEQSFFQLAFQRLEEKLYNLLPYLVGFEVINKSPDDAKALGVFGFMSDNKQMLFVPAFFINGDVKGVDILYSKNQEQFFPLTEEFAEMFLKDDATGMGKPSHESEQKINQDMPTLDLQSLVRPPRTGKVSYASVIDYVEQADNKVKTAFYNWFRDDMDFSEAVLKYYPVEKIAKAIVPKVAAEKVLPMTSVKVYSKDDDLSDLSDNQRQEVYQKGRIVIDERREDQKSKFGLFNYPSKFSSPTESGFYNYLTNSGSLRYALILTHPMGLISHYPTNGAIVIDLDSSKDGQAYVAKASDIYVKGKYTIKEFSDVLSGMTDPAEAKPSYKDTYILINEKFAATVPFTITMNYKDDNGMRRIGIEPASMVSGEYDSIEVGSSWSRRKAWDNSFYSNKEKKPTKFTLVMTKKPGDKLEYDHDAIYVPKGFKLFPLKLNYSCCDGMEYEPNETSETRKKKEDDRKARRELYMRGKPGNKSNLMGALREESIYPMSVSSNGSEYFLTVAEAKKKYDNAIKVKVAMITELGLSEKQADELLVSFRPHVSNRISGHIKFAYTGDNSFAPWDPTAYANQLGQPTYDGVGHQEIMQTGDGYKQDPTRMGLAGMPEIEGHPPQQGGGPQAAINQASQLAQSGQKEIFDTHTIATLAKYVSPDSKVTSYTPDFVSCLDKLGRMLFLVHWETDKFEQMYGRSELPELVELLTNVFNNLGDLVIFLKRKSPQLSINMSEKDIGV